ncbi:MAG: hypothetical protein AABX51_02890 [Nanoarchaeota archaeon]
MGLEEHLNDGQLHVLNLHEAVFTAEVDTAPINDDLESEFPAARDYEIAWKDAMQHLGSCYDCSDRYAFMKREDTPVLLSLLEISKARRQISSVEQEAKLEIYKAQIKYYRSK